jgi:hypothetical protein
MSRHSLTQFFKLTSNKRKLQVPDGDHETTVTKKNAKKSKRNFPGQTQKFFSRQGLVLESVRLAKNHLQIARG